jgi:hypothetical protein
VFENRVLRRTFGQKRYEIIGGWRKLYNEELHNLYASPNIFRLIKSRSMRLVGHVECLGEECINGISVKPRRKETTRKTKT